MTRLQAERQAFRVVTPAAVVALAAAAALGWGEHYAVAKGLWLVRCSGWGALVALGLALCATPVSRLADRLAPGRFPLHVVAAYRRSLGIGAAVMATLHLAVALLTYLRGAWWAILDQPFLRSGLIALVVLIILAATSFPAVVRAARIKLWKPLHRLAYVAAALTLHHLLLSPFAPRVVVLAFFGALLAVGLLRGLRRAKPSP